MTPRCWATFSAGNTPTESQFVIAIERSFEIRSALKDRGYYYDNDWWGHDFLACSGLKVWRRDYPATPAGHQACWTEIQQLRKLNLIGEIKYQDTLSRWLETGLHHQAIAAVFKAFRVETGHRREADGSSLSTFHAYVGSDAEAAAAIQRINGARMIDKKKCWSIPQRNIWRDDLELIVSAARMRSIGVNV